MPPSGPQDIQERDRQRQALQSRLSTSLEEEEDPLATYVQFVQWINKNYADNDPSSALQEVLKDAIATFKNDSTYKNDLRYLKLWIQYARTMDCSAAVVAYASLMKNQIGISYSVLYEEYAELLEAEGKISDADHIFRSGIKRQARPVERLKSRYRGFRARNASASSSSAIASTSSSTLSPTMTASTAQSRYALMLAPPAPGKRPEKLRYNTSLLFTEEGMEYSVQEARARSMGLLGKKWTALPISSIVSASSSTSSVRVTFDDDGRRSRTQGYGTLRKSMMNGEPTLTINTKEALADVFGMYNSPEKTMKLTGPGSKHAPLRKVEPMASFSQKQVQPPLETQGGGSKPSIDENAGRPRKENKPKFTPFFDSKENETFLTSRPASVLTEAPTFSAPTTFSSGGFKNRSTSEPDIIFSKVFTPANPKPALPPLREAFTEDHGRVKPKPIPTHERAKSCQDVLLPPSDVRPATFTFIDENNQRTPFKVFSRPPEAENFFTPKTPASTFTPFVDSKPTSTPYRDEPTPTSAEENAQVPHTSPPSSVLDTSIGAVETAEELAAKGEAEENGCDHFLQDGYVPEEYETPIEDHDDSVKYPDGEGYQGVPLGGRFGQFNVMTPITERTLEYTSTRSVFTNTPGDHLHEEYDLLDGEQTDEDENQWEKVQPWQPTNHPNHFARDELPALEEKTRKLSLADALTLSASFRPSNPCNPFDPSILSTMLSLVSSDEDYHDLRDQQSNLLDDLQKFAKKARKASGGSHAGALDFSSSLPVTLHGRRYRVLDKLGEGGFGAVFQAKSLGICDENEDEDDLEDDDDDLQAMIALKVVRPRNIWEYHVLRRLHSVLPLPYRPSVVQPHALFAFRDESFMAMDFCSQGTLLGVVTKAIVAGVHQQGACLDELLVVFFAIELIRLLEAMHQEGFIHGDLKIDNCLLRLEDVPGGASAWSSLYQPSGEGGWSSKGIKLIDFGRTIDTRLFPSGQQFTADWATDERDCFEIREDRPWTYQTDYFGLAGIVYCLLFGKYFQSNSITDSGGRYKIATPFKRYWQTYIWNDFFDLLLNPCQIRKDGSLPLCSELESIRVQMEMWLQANCNRTSNTLKGLLKKVEMACLR
ncbi:uncharacterized protein BT62DRAFT_941869 [Guyanagaster necrorhizus]|uniref:Uncharacterized protein n=1 Tax=Guyanagaster necrorhizus TaxID=856835 RepID=A0A9P8AWX6_9AGAR|nr:uncharacterized protein BT62DRAFT_941869 [Guyanagaster necrorhizus MCA 3950]KAG7451159.1 hypothetical protein BT62DRAFT_941869 [Guyanagaster necrorhizus MCA 3950]